VFQFTRPRGARPCTPGAGPPPRTGFNSRAHAGRDEDDMNIMNVLKGFNSRAHAGRDGA